MMRVATQDTVIQLIAAGPAEVIAALCTAHDYRDQGGFPSGSRTRVPLNPSY